jgi:hypothetical protein
MPVALSQWFVGVQEGSRYSLPALLLVIIKELTWDRFAGWANPRLDDAGLPVIPQIAKAVVWLVSAWPPMTLVAVVLVGVIVLAYRDSRQMLRHFPKATNPSERGWLDRYVDAQRDLHRFEKIVGGISKHQLKMNERLVKHTRRMEGAEATQRRSTSSRSQLAAISRVTRERWNATTASYGRRFAGRRTWQPSSAVPKANFKAFRSMRRSW